MRSTTASQQQQYPPTDISRADTLWPSAMQHGPDWLMLLHYLLSTVNLQPLPCWLLRRMSRTSLPSMSMPNLLWTSHKFSGAKRTNFIYNGNMSASPLYITHIVGI